MIMLFHRGKLLHVIMMAMIMVVIMIVAVVVLVRGAQGFAHCVASMKVPVAK